MGASNTSCRRWPYKHQSKGATHCGISAGADSAAVAEPDAVAHADVNDIAELALPGNS